MKVRYRCIDYLSTPVPSSMQCTASQVKINLTLLQYRTAVVGADTTIQALQLTATQLQWTMNAA